LLDFEWLSMMMSCHLLSSCLISVYYGKLRDFCHVITDGTKAFRWLPRHDYIGSSSVLPTHMLTRTEEPQCFQELLSDYLKTALPGRSMFDCLAICHWGSSSEEWPVLCYATLDRWTVIRKGRKIAVRWTSVYRISSWCFQIMLELKTINGI